VPSASSPVITLTFDVAAGKQLQIDSYSFWRGRTPSAPQNWSMTINGTAVGSGTVPTTGASTGITAVTNPVTGLTGNVTIVLTLSNATGTGSLRLDSFVLNGTVTTPCVAPVISSVIPLSGPAGTTVTLNGNGFMAGTSSVKINGTETTFTVVSDNKITAVVPANASSGPVSITTNGCPATASNFTVLATNCPQGPAPTDIYISELYDHTPGSYGMIELYNPTNNTITFSGQYVLERYGTIGDDSPSYTLILSGSIGPESTYLVRSYGTGVLGCTVAEDANMGSGINASDEFKLKKNSVVIDVTQAPSYTGYTVIREPDAVAPSATYNSSDWTDTSSFSCDDLDNHNALPAAPSATIITQPQSQSVCENGTDTFTVAVDNAAGFTYQWKMLNAAGVWVNVTDNADYAGATTNTLTVSQVPAGFNGNQYYVQISSGSCTLISNAVNLTVLPLPAVADVTPTQPTCTTPTGTIVVNSPTGAGLTYSINGGAFQSSTTFANLAPGPYTVTVQNTDGCTSVTPTITINAVPNAPAVADVTPTQPTCTTPTGTIVVNSPTGAGLTYSINGGAFQASTTFANLAPGAYTITVQNTDGCTSVTPTITINTVPNAPAVADVTPTQPTCTTPTGTIVVNSPTGAGLTYSINGGAFQASTTFANLAPGAYTITVQNTDGCTSVAPTITINAVPNAPAVADVTPTQPTCTTPTGTIVVNSPTGAGLTYSINGGAFQSSTTFANLAPGAYTITVQNTDGCTSVAPTITINAVPNAPAVADVTPTQPTCTTPTGTIVVNSPTGAGLTYSINGGAFQSSATFANLAPGPYTITVQNGDGCTSVTSTITINATATPIQITTVQGCEDTMSGKKYILQALPLNGSFDINTADFEWRYNGMIVGSNETIFNVTDYASFNNIDPAQFPLEFTVTVTSGGCVESASFIVESTFCTIPKGVSPNNDTLNDNFNLIGLNVNKLSIFNRYGKEVYSKSNYRNEWHGQTDSDSELPTGTYYYVIERTTGSTESGWVYLNREN
jgi:gliding motility-associated-like protein